MSKATVVGGPNDVRDKTLMSSKGRKFMFHGAFGSKAKAKVKERKVGGFIRRVKMRNSTRYLVMTRRKSG